MLFHVVRYITRVRTDVFSLWRNCHLHNYKVSRVVTANRRWREGFSSFSKLNGFEQSKIIIVICLLSVKQAVFTRYSTGNKIYPCLDQKIALNCRIRHFTNYFIYKLVGFFYIKLILVYIQLWGVWHFSLTVVTYLCEESR